MSATQAPLSPAQRYSGAIPYRIHNGRIQVLLITSRSGGRWCVPKGRIQAGMTPEQSARNEVREEAGVDGTMAGFSVGTYHHRKRSGGVSVGLYLMHVTRVRDHWLEAHQRQRQWTDLHNAIAIVAFAGLRDILKRMPDLIPEAQLAQAVEAHRHAG